MTVLQKMCSYCISVKVYYDTAIDFYRGFMDIHYLLFLQNVRDKLPDAISRCMMLVSDIDLIMRYAIPLVLFWCLSKEGGVFVSFAQGFSGVLNQFLKNTFCIYRPWIRSEEIMPYRNAKLTATGYSFPSGHSQIASSVYGGTAFYYRRNRALFIAMIFMTLLTGFSRNYLGCHTPQDVCVGLLEGAVFVIFTHYLTKWLSKNERRDTWVLIGGVVFALAMIFYAEFKPYPVDYIDGKIIVDPEKMKIDCFGSGGFLIGIVLGWFLERRFVRFEIAGVWWKKVIRAIVGISIAILMYVGLGTFFYTVGLHEKMIACMLEFILELYILFIGPLVITVIRKLFRAKPCEWKPKN